MGYSTYRIDNKSLVIFNDNKGKKEYAGYYPRDTEIAKVNIVSKWNATWLYGMVIKDGKTGYFDISYLKGAQLESVPDNSTNILEDSKNIVENEIVKMNSLRRETTDTKYSDHLKKIRLAFVSAKNRLNRIDSFVPDKVPNETYPFDGELKIGDEGENVVNLQKLISKWHMDPYLNKIGVFDEGTRKAIYEFQIGMSLNITGIADENTWTLLNQPAIDFSRWLTPQASDNPEDDGRLPFECNCNGKYCDSKANAQLPELSAGLLIMIERGQVELNRRYGRTDIVVRLTDDMDTSDHDDRNGGNRCPRWNGEHGGVSGSKHIKNCAADLFLCCPYRAGKIAPTNHNLWEVFNEFNPHGGVGEYSYNIHLDTWWEDGRRRW